MSETISPIMWSICNRSSKCGYRYTAKQYFADNPTGSKFVKTRVKKRSNSNYGFAAKPFSANLTKASSQPDYISFEHFQQTLGGHNDNALVKFLLNLFPDCSEEIQGVLKMYFVGTYEEYTCFPSIDRLNRICRAKLIRFDQTTGKRLKGNYDTSSLPAKLKLKEDFQYKQIFFGEHLLSLYPNKPAAVVEAEKTAAVASLCIPQFIWQATGSKQWLKAERLERLRTRQIILYPDADGFSVWQKIAADAQRLGVQVKISSLIENRATAEQKAAGYDLAVYLIAKQNKINENNKLIDEYNAKLEIVLTDESLRRDFDTILEERKSIAIISGGASEIEAENQLSCPDFYRQIVKGV